MNYKIKIELKSAISEDDRNRMMRSDHEPDQTVLNITKVVEADTEKQALQKVINLISDKDIK